MGRGVLVLKSNACPWGMIDQSESSSQPCLVKIIIPVSTVAHRAGCLGFWCPCVLPCRVSADHGEGLCLPLLECWSGVVPAVSLGLRISVRERYRIRGSICDDCCIVTFCGICSYCQLARELKERRCRHTQVISSTTVQVNSNPSAYYPVQGYGPPQ
uniref:Plac8 onzin related protein 6 n=1 Tax=Gadus morhua TaxID=8049 RepID=A0A8C5BYV5_GADMO